MINVLESDKEKVNNSRKRNEIEWEKRIMSRYLRLESRFLNGREIVPKYQVKIIAEVVEEDCRCESYFFSLSHACVIAVI